MSHRISISVTHDFIEELDAFVKKYDFDKSQVMKVGFRLFKKSFEDSTNKQDLLKCFQKVV